MPASTRRYAPSVTALALTLALFAAPAALGDEPSLVVLKSAGAAQKPGDKLPGSTAIKLADGQSLTLIASDGKVITLKGPYEGPAAKVSEVKSASITDVLQPLMAQSKVETATPGVIRNASETGPDKDAMVLDTSKGGDFCIHMGADYDVWRADHAAADSATIQPAAGGAATKIDFEPSKSRASLPASVKFVDGAKYKVSVGGKTTEITVHVVPETVPLDKMTVAWFASDKCDVQARALLKSL